MKRGVNRRALHRSGDQRTVGENLASAVGRFLVAGIEAFGGPAEDAAGGPRRDFAALKDLAPPADRVRKVGPAQEAFDVTWHAVDIVGEFVSGESAMRHGGQARSFGRGGKGGFDGEGPGPRHPPARGPGPRRPPGLGPVVEQFRWAGRGG